MNRDAIEWMQTAPADLLELEPRDWMQTQMRQHRNQVQFWRDDLNRTDPSVIRADGRAWAGDVDVGSGWLRISIITANGEIAYHRDPGFEKYGYLLILRPAGYSVTGLYNWRGEEVQQRGMMLCLHQARRLHALVRRGTSKSHGVRLKDTYGLHTSTPGRVWMAIGFNSEKLLTLEEASEVFRTDLGKRPVNAARRLTA
ncbi:hypothetical protein CcrColossus_gp332 [Caulobacter phage CcrColossus]|uniref:Uncharacterized protein n=1 Tax=Caulobacter phage CcrColossus TaxID=1211640 RepID=K4K6K5_9CAUD|nr:hypothetical protein CcrColossus_gp332 [Caulobacter phage CcrColossus]AFU88202.1 hypothetical protein CcrColossus_gp332 [Caulobacter phage CcrColossus]